MSALGTTVRVNSEKQTLILAGETVPQRFAYGALPLGRPLTLVATPVDDTRLIAQRGFEDLSPESSALPRDLVSLVADHGSAYSAATAYARTQQLSLGSSRSTIIDTYA